MPFVESSDGRHPTRSQEQEDGRVRAGSARECGDPGCVSDQGARRLARHKKITYPLARFSALPMAQGPAARRALPLRGPAGSKESGARGSRRMIVEELIQVLAGPRRMTADSIASVIEIARTIDARDG